MGIELHMEDMDSEKEMTWGKSIFDFAIVYDLVIANTLFQKKTKILLHLGVGNLGLNYLST